MVWQHTAAELFRPPAKLLQLTTVFLALSFQACSAEMDGLEHSVIFDPKSQFAMSQPLVLLTPTTPDYWV